MNKQEAKAILEEAKAIYENAKDYYYELRGSKCGDTMLRGAEKSMYQAYEHLLDMQYYVSEQLSTYSVGNAGMI